jgi:hypothetical protein
MLSTHTMEFVMLSTHTKACKPPHDSTRGEATLGALLHKPQMGAKARRHLAPGGGGGAQHCGTSNAQATHRCKSTPVRRHKRLSCQGLTGRPTYYPWILQQPQLPQTTDNESCNGHNEARAREPRREAQLPHVECRGVQARCTHPDTGSILVRYMFELLYSSGHLNTVPCTDLSSAPNAPQGTSICFAGGRPLFHNEPLQMQTASRQAKQRCRK